MKKLPLPLLFALCLLGTETVLSFSTPLVWLVNVAVHEVPATILLRLFQAVGVLIFFFTLGAAFGSVREGRTRRGILFLILTFLARFYGTILSLVWQGLFFAQAISEATLSAVLTSVLLSYATPFLILFLLSYFTFLKKAPLDEVKNYRDLSASPVRAALLSAGLYLLYRLVDHIFYFFAYVKERFGFLFMETGEKLALFLDFIPVLVVPIGGYFITLLGRRLYLHLSSLREKNKKTP